MKTNNFNSENHVKNLPDFYNKKESSNNYKLLLIEKEAIDALRVDQNAVFDSLDINNATGFTLDLYGEMVGQQRGVATDDQFRCMIRSKIMRNMSDGDYASVTKAVVATFDCTPQEIYIKPKEDDEGNFVPCVVELVTLPLGVISKAGLTTKQTVQLIQSLLPICVTLESFLFEGTFTFSNIEDEYNENAGFCDVEGGTIGGYFGILYGQDDEPILPIE